jgi:hypothetical protein
MKNTIEQKLLNYLKEQLDLQNIIFTNFHPETNILIVVTQCSHIAELHYLHSLQLKENGEIEHRCNYTRHYDAELLEKLKNLFGQEIEKFESCL